MKRLWVVLPVSAALHVLGLLALLWVVSRVVELPRLFVDLSTLARDGGRSGSAPSARRTHEPSSGPPSPDERAPAAGRSGGRMRPDLPQRPSAKAAPAPPTAESEGDKTMAPTLVPLPADAGTAPALAAREERQEVPVTVPESVRPRTSSSGGLAAAAGEATAPAPGPSVTAGPEGTPEPFAPDPSAGDGDRRGGVPGNRAGVGPGTGGGTGADGGEAGRGAGDSALARSRAGPGPGGTEYGAYYAQWRRRIQENLRYPLAARRRNLAGTVHLDIVIEANGAVAGVQVAEPSGHRLLDDAAVETVRELPPLPFPSHLVPRPLRLRLPVVFDLR
jgi:TonB family protein